ncbi:uncharacterized protein FTJAE_4843 [Fusarium tjaetaba]|uniref:Uncharacterized protein n=1 Tax=Fusarium tjaetaba TaxID=1567544 RepID=A0A8H5RQ50_9HYPO|nr:uncharacterized protein FTJAE_4843 [Fusarium tjaetaba]KAF5639505.1 hypothetical protein FTJAE_4843 [Fusarium tjaetaba]
MPEPPEFGPMSLQGKYASCLHLESLSRVEATPANSQLSRKAEAESFFLLINVGWFDGGDKRGPIVKREPSSAEDESFFLQTDAGWFDGGDKKRATGGAGSEEWAS